MPHTINVSKLNDKLGKILSKSIKEMKIRQHCTPSKTMALLRNFGSAEEKDEKKEEETLHVYIAYARKHAVLSYNLEFNCLWKQ